MPAILPEIHYTVKAGIMAHDHNDIVASRANQEPQIGPKLEIQVILRGLVCFDVFDDRLRMHHLDVHVKGDGFDLIAVKDDDPVSLLQVFHA